MLGSDPKEVQSPGLDLTDSNSEPGVSHSASPSLEIYSFFQFTEPHHVLALVLGKHGNNIRYPRYLTSGTYVRYSSSLNGRGETKDKRTGSDQCLNETNSILKQGGRAVREASLKI